MVDESKLNATDNAGVWASEFMATFADRLGDVDEATMIAWFANAIETAKRITLKDKLEVLGPVAEGQVLLLKLDHVPEPDALRAFQAISTALDALVFVQGPMVTVTIGAPGALPVEVEAVDDGEYVVLPRDALFEFFGMMALPPWQEADGTWIGGSIDCAPLAAQITEWVNTHDLAGLYSLTPPDRG